MKIFQTVLFFLAAALLLPQTASAQNCRPGTYYNPGSYGIAAGCSSCYAGCKECSGGSPGECTVCMEGTFMIRSPAPSNNWNCAGCSTLFPITGGQCTKCTQSSCTEVRLTPSGREPIFVPISVSAAASAISEKLPCPIQVMAASRKSASVGIG